jgi:hypothetical protein
VFNGALTGKSMELRWTTRWDRPDGPEVANGTVGPFEIEPGFHSPQTVQFTAPIPERNERVLYLVLEAVKEGQVVYREDRLHFVVTGRNPGDKEN